MITGVTTSGYKYAIDENILADWRVVKKLAKLKELEESDEGALAFISVMGEIEELIFKDKGKAFEKAILKKNDGIVAPVVCLTELMEIFKQAKQAKNC